MNGRLSRLAGSGLVAAALCLTAGCGSSSGPVGAEPQAQRLRSERDQALAERDRALMDRDVALAERDAARAARDRATSQGDHRVSGGFGLVSRAEYDKLYAAWETLTMQHTAQRQLLAVTEAELKTVKQERARLMIEHDEAAKVWRTRYELLDAAYRKLLAETQTEAPKGAVVGGPLPKAVNDALMAFAKGHGLDYDPARGAVCFSSDLLFDPGRHTLNPAAARRLADLAKIVNMQAALPFDVLVVGHTDGMPVVRAEVKDKTPTNRHLSVYRAVSVVAALESEQVDGKRLAAAGFGGDRPRPGTNNNVTKAPGTPANRRIEVFLAPHQSLSAPITLAERDSLPSQHAALQASLTAAKKLIEALRAERDALASQQATLQANLATAGKLIEALREKLKATTQRDR